MVRGAYYVVVVIAPCEIVEKVIRNGEDVYIIIMDFCAFYPI